MIVFIAIGALLFFVTLGWMQRQRVFARGEWRLGAGLLAVGALVGALFVTVRGEWPVGLGLLVASGVMTALARSDRAKWTRRAAVDPSVGLSDSDARAILGVGSTAGPSEIRAAYNRLMRVNHPDAGGTDGLAAQLNAARDRLLRS